MLPLYLLTSAKNQPILVELKNGETLNGNLVICDSWMNLTLSNVIQSSANGDDFLKIPEVYVRGNHIKYLRLPNEVMDNARQQALDNSKYNNNNRRDHRGGNRRDNRGGNRGYGNRNYNNNNNNSNNNNNNNNNNRGNYGNRGYRHYNNNNQYNSNNNQRFQQNLSDVQQQQPVQPVQSLQPQPQPQY